MKYHHTVLLLLVLASGSSATTTSLRHKQSSTVTSGSGVSSSAAAAAGAVEPTEFFTPKDVSQWEAAKVAEKTNKMREITQTIAAKRVEVANAIAAQAPAKAVVAAATKHREEALAKLEKAKNDPDVGKHMASFAKNVEEQLAEHTAKVAELNECKNEHGVLNHANNRITKLLTNGYAAQKAAGKPVPSKVVVAEAEAKIVAPATAALARCTTKLATAKTAAEDAKKELSMAKIAIANAANPSGVKKTYVLAWYARRPARDPSRHAL